MVRWEDGDRAVLWNEVTGRAVVVGLDTDLDAPGVRARLERMHMTGPVDVDRLVPARSRLPLVLTEGLWAPHPGVRTAGGHGWRLVPWPPSGLAIWDAINDARTVVEVARRAGLAREVVVAALSRWTAPDVQLVQLRDAPLPRPDASFFRLVAAPRPDHARTEDQYGAHGQTTLTDYHLHAITDGATHFDDRETTVAHALALPHPALDGVPFGRRLYEALDARGLVRGRIVEIGGGTGELAAAFWGAARAPGRSWLRVDLSPELLRTQATRVDAPGLLADATALPLRDGSVDLVVCNEVIADLEAGPAPPELVARYGPAPGVSNVGAWRLLEELARVLAPGGAAYVAEFGGDAAPEEARQLDHPEVSIDFGRLAAVARALGLEVERIGMAELLTMRLDAPQLARASWEGLRALARSRGLHLAARAYTPDTVPLVVEGLRWVPMTDEGPGPLVTRFEALILTKPG